MKLYLNSQSRDLNQKRMTPNALTAVVIRHPCSKMVVRSSQLVFAAASFLELSTFSEYSDVSELFGIDITSYDNVTVGTLKLYKPT